jgi:hypothetical protein
MVTKIREPTDREMSIYTDIDALNAKDQTRQELVMDECRLRTMMELTSHEKERLDPLTYKYLSNLYQQLPPLAVIKSKT